MSDTKVDMAKITGMLETNGPGHERLHAWFGLSYAAYLTIPRSVLQSMPDELQSRLAAVLEEMDEVAGHHHFQWPPEGAKAIVRLRKNGKFIKDPFADYQRGRRRIVELTA